MDCWGALFLVLLATGLVISSGCIANPLAGNETVGSQHKSPEPIETPTLPGQYVAQPHFSEKNPAEQQPLPVKTRDRPLLTTGSTVTINGTGLGGGSTANATVKKIITYLNTTNTNNQTENLAEQQFWNQVAAVIIPKIDGGNTVTRDFALNHTSPAHSGTYNVQQVADIWDYTEPAWTYVSDPLNPDGQFWDYFSAASETISVGLKGDCDDFAILNAATVEAIGGNSRVIYAANPGGAHMYAEAQFADSSFNSTLRMRYPNATIHYHPGNWLNLDWFDYPNHATNPGGNFYPDGGIIWVIYKDGHWEKQKQNGTTWDVILHGP